MLLKGLGGLFRVTLVLDLLTLKNEHKIRVLICIFTKYAFDDEEQTTTPS